MPSFGAEWEWSAGIAPALEIENRPLAEFLAWMAREHGWQVRYADERCRRARSNPAARLARRLDGAAMLERVALVTGVPLGARRRVVGGPRGEAHDASGRVVVAALGRRRRAALGRADDPRR